MFQADLVETTLNLEKKTKLSFILEKIQTTDN